MFSLQGIGGLLVVRERFFIEPDQIEIGSSMVGMAFDTRPLGSGVVGQGLGQGLPDLFMAIQTELVRYFPKPLMTKTAVVHPFVFGMGGGERTWAEQLAQRL